MSATSACQIVHTNVSPNYGSNQQLGTAGLHIPIEPSVLAVSVSITIGGASSNVYSDAVFHFNDATGRQVLSVQLIAGAEKGSSQSQTFPLASGVTIASVDCYSWWNPCTLQSLTITYIPTEDTATTENLASGQILGAILPVIIPVSGCNYVTSAQFTATNLPGKISAVRLQFKDANGNLVGEGSVNPSNRQSASATYDFVFPSQVASVVGYSWWNPATLNSLSLTYLTGE